MSYFRVNRKAPAKAPRCWASQEVFESVVDEGATGGSGISGVGALSS